ncbi:MAG: hypothetical protein ACXVIS_05425 [Halobacteriota archaeon]
MILKDVHLQVRREIPIVDEQDGVKIPKTRQIAAHIPNENTLSSRVIV